MIIHVDVDVVQHVEGDVKELVQHNVEMDVPVARENVHNYA